MSLIRQMSKDIKLSPQERAAIEGTYPSTAPYTGAPDLPIESEENPVVEGLGILGGAGMVKSLGKGLAGTVARMAGKRAGRAAGEELGALVPLPMSKGGPAGVGPTGIVSDGPAPYESLPPPGPNLGALDSLPPMPPAGGTPGMRSRIEGPPDMQMPVDMHAAHQFSPNTGKTPTGIRWVGDTVPPPIDPETMKRLLNKTGR